MHKYNNPRIKHLNTELFIKEATQIHGNTYIYDKSIYKNTYSKITITCKKHGDFQQEPSNHLRGTGCPHCNKSKKSNTKEFVIKSKNVHGEEYIYDKVDYITSRKNVIIICRKHGDFEQMPAVHLQGSGCAECNNELRSVGTDEFIKLVKVVHGEKYIYDKVIYKNNREKVIITCPIHGDFLQRPSNHLLGIGCKDCGVESSARSRSLDTEEFITKVNSIHGELYIYDKVIYKNHHTKIIIICRKHGDFKQQPNNHLSGNGCPKCLKTRKQNLWLDSLGIPNDAEHREVAIYVKGKKRPFRADGYDSNNNTIYEFNGDSWHGNPEFYEPTKFNRETQTTYGQLYEKTLEKERMLKEAGYIVISIWESDFDKIIKTKP